MEIKSQSQPKPRRRVAREKDNSLGAGSLCHPPEHVELSA
jgi:hypothetical protein